MIDSRLPDCKGETGTRRNVQVKGKRKLQVTILILLSRVGDLRMYRDGRFYTNAPGEMAAAFIHDTFHEITSDR